MRLRVYVRFLLALFLLPFLANANSPQALEEYLSEKSVRGIKDIVKKLKTNEKHDEFASNLEEMIFKTLKNQPKDFNHDKINQMIEKWIDMNSHLLDL